MNKPSQFDLSIIIPCYNEQDRIKKTIEKTDHYFKQRSLNYEIIAIDDGSSDDTLLYLNDMSERYPGLIVIHYAQNKGKGYAVKKGVWASRGELILYMDADLATPIEEFEKLAPVVDSGVDIAFGSRALSSSDILIRQPLYRELMGRTFNAMVQGLAVKGVMDTQCGFKLLRRTSAVFLFEKIISNTYTFDVELLFLAQKLGYQIREIPVRWKHVPLSRVHPIIDSALMARDLLLMRVRHRHT